MSSVRIITDSAAELTLAQAAELGVSVVPLRYSVDNVVLKQDVDISSDRLLELLAQGNAAITPLPPAVDDIARLLESVARAGQVALYLHVADGLLPVSEPIQNVAQGLFGRARIEVIDSLAVSYSLQRQVRAVARAAAGGDSLAAVTQLARSMVSRVYTLFYAQDFGHLEKTADIQPAQALLASILGVRPLVVLEEGRLLPLEKVTPRSTPADKLTDFVSEFASVAEMAILLGPREPDFAVEEFRQRVLQQYPHLAIPVLNYGPLVAASVGPSAVGVYVYEGIQVGW